MISLLQQDLFQSHILVHTVLRYMICAQHPEISNHVSNGIEAGVGTSSCWLIGESVLKFWRQGFRLVL